MGLFSRIYHHPKFIPIFAPFAVVSFVLSTIALAMTLAQDQQIEDDRIAADIASCERGNVGRQSDIDVAMATEDLIEGILGVVFARASNPNLATEIGTELEPLFNEHREIVGRIRIIDCETVVPGGSTPTTIKENP